VHSSPKLLQRYDWKVHVTTADNPTGCTFFVAKRPHIDSFLRAVSRWYEVVVFTASLQHYADPVIDLLDPGGLVCRRFFRGACVEQKGNFVKDLSAVRSDLSQVVIIDNTPSAYRCQNCHHRLAPRALSQSLTWPHPAFTNTQYERRAGEGKARPACPKRGHQCLF
jgi:Dullard-like phosphatase family protein